MRIKFLAPLLMWAANGESHSRLSEMEINRRLTANPECTAHDSTAITTTCNCNRGGTCAATKFCMDNSNPDNLTCKDTLKCAGVNGEVKATAPCSCPQSGSWESFLVTATNSFCHKAGSQVLTTGICANKAGAVANTDACTCGQTATYAGVANAAGKFCTVDTVTGIAHITTAAIAACAAQGGHTAATIPCFCTTIAKVADVGKFCYVDSTAAKHVLDYAICTAWDGKTAATAKCSCRTGGTIQNVNVGQYCWESATNNGYVLDHPLCTNTDGNTVSPSTCICPADNGSGWARVYAGQYCTRLSGAAAVGSDMPRAPLCPNRDGVTAQTSTCSCDPSQLMQQIAGVGSYCHGDNVKAYPRCPNRDGSAAATSTCVCGSSLSPTKPGQHCFEQFHSHGRVTNGPMCSHTDGQTANTAACDCYDFMSNVSVPAAAGQYCWRYLDAPTHTTKRARVLEAPPCTGVDGRTEATSDCVCYPKSSNPIYRILTLKGRYCLEAGTSTTALPMKMCDYSDGRVAETEECICMKQHFPFPVEKGEYCNVSPRTCEHSDGETPNERPCYCKYYSGTTTVFDFCWGKYNLCTKMPNMKYFQGYKGESRCSAIPICKLSPIPVSKPCICAANADGSVSWAGPIQIGQICGLDGDEVKVFDNIGLILGLSIPGGIIFLCCCIVAAYCIIKKKNAANDN